MNRWQISDGQAGSQSHPELHREFLSRRQPEVTALDELAVVIDEADRAVRKGDEQNDPDVRIENVGPQQCRNENGDVDQNAAHRRRSRFLLMRLRSFFANELTELD